MQQYKHTCPFSKRGCRECPIFRGRHVRLCFYKNYTPEKAATTLEAWETGYGKRWELPELPAHPTWIVLNHFAEGDAPTEERSSV
jgi:hypothetical protein